MFENHLSKETIEACNEMLKCGLELAKVKFRYVRK